MTKPLVLRNRPMAGLRRRACAALVAAGITVGLSATPAEAEAPASDAADLLFLLNGERTARGMAPLRSEATLVAGAAAHADALAAGRRLFHTSMTGTAPEGWTRLGENVATAADVQAVHRALLASPTHRALMLEPTFDYVGIGVTHGDAGSHWVSMKLADHPSTGLAPGGGPTRQVSRTGTVSASGLSFHGDLSGTALAAPIVGLVATPSGSGYWLVGSDGGVFTFGDARWYGSLGGTPLAAPVVGMAALPDGSGYWLASADGGVFSFGGAPFLGSAVGRPDGDAITGINRTSGGGGYALRSGNGERRGFGDAR